jgi:hypothetical protein
MKMYFISHNLGLLGDCQSLESVFLRNLSGEEELKNSCLGFFFDFYSLVG